MDGTFGVTADGRPALRFERRLRHPIEKAWRAISDPAELSVWFPWRVELEPRVGGRLTFAHPRGLADAPDAVITEYDPPRVFGYRWNGEDLRWELTEDGAGCVLVLTQTLADRPAAAKVAAGWHVSLDALELALAGQPPDVPHSRWIELNRAYVAEFGLLEGEVRDTADGPQLRFEQELVVPAAVVWSVLAEGAQLGERPPDPVTVPDVAAGPVTELLPGRAVGYPATDGGAVRFELVPQDFGTRVVLTHTRPPGVARRAWHARLTALAEELDRRPLER